MSNNFHQAVCQSLDPIKLIHTVLDQTFKPARLEHKLVASVPYTPPKLIEEIFHKIPTINNRCLTASICVLYTIEMAVFLSGLGFENITVVTREHDQYTEDRAEAFGYKYLLEQQVKETGMKFDVVVGNPPYQDAIAAEGRKTATKPLWFDFVELATGVVFPTGYVALVTPSAWIQPTSKIHATICIHHKVLTAKVFSKSPFAGVMTTTSYWILTPGSGIGTFPLVVDDRQFDVPVDSFTPADPSEFELAFGILSKTVNAREPKIGFVATQEHHTGAKAQQLSPIRTAEHSYPVFHTNTQTKWSSVMGRLHNKHKVIVSKTGSFRGARVDFEHSISQIALACVTSTAEEANRLLEVLWKKLYQYLISSVRVNSTIPSDLWRSLPAVDLSRSWTDEQLYAHFNLTQEEINLIEATVK